MGVCNHHTTREAHLNQVLPTFVYVTTNQLSRADSFTGRGTLGTRPISTDPGRFRTHLRPVRDRHLGVPLASWSSSGVVGAFVGDAFDDISILVVSGPHDGLLCRIAYVEHRDPADGSLPDCRVAVTDADNRRLG